MKFAAIKIDPEVLVAGLLPLVSFLFFLVLRGDVALAIFDPAAWRSLDLFLFTVLLICLVVTNAVGQSCIHLSMALRTRLRKLMYRAWYLETLPPAERTPFDALSVSLVVSMPLVGAGLYEATGYSAASLVQLIGLTLLSPMYLFAFLLFSDALDNANAALRNNANDGGQPL